VDAKMSDHNFSRIFQKSQGRDSSPLVLDQGSRVAVIGGGPAGSFFSYFLLDMAERINLKINIDIYEPRDFTHTAPTGCNMCGGVIYESLVQSLAVEGINLPTTVVQRGIECNMLHLDIGSIQIKTQRPEKRIATTFRGAGPRDLKKYWGVGLDGYLLQTAITKGARHIPHRVTEVNWHSNPSTNYPENKLVQITTKGTGPQTYELVAITSGVNTGILKQFLDLNIGYQPPRTIKLCVREYRLGEEAVLKHLGPVFHGFLLDIPGLDYGAIIPKGKYVTVCLLSGHGDLDPSVMDMFLSDPAVKDTLPSDFSPINYTCHCGPRINVMGCSQPFADRMVFIGDSGVSRLYKDGIGAAYRAAKIAASTVVFHGISANDFKKYYLPFCRKMDFDNRIGKLLFTAINQVKKMQFARRAVLRMVAYEQQGLANAERGMSMVMWDMLTGGAPYIEVLKRVFHPAFWTSLLWNITVSLFSRDSTKHVEKRINKTTHQQSTDSQNKETNAMEIGALGKTYQDGEIIVRQGERGDCMYVVQNGFVEVMVDSGDQQVQLRTLGKDEFFGEMAIFEHEIRTATVRARGPVRILSVDHRNLLQRIHEDPSLAYRLMKVMSNRIEKLSEEIARLEHQLSEFKSTKNS
jgi:CRP-like cAMP-binding protein/flavin-dependent dehydrogenase